MLAESDGLTGDFTGVFKLVAKFLIGENNIDGLALLAKLAGDLVGIVIFIGTKGDDGDIDGGLGGFLDEVIGAENIEQTSEADRAADARENLVGKVASEVLVATAATDRTNVSIVGEDIFKYGAGVVI